MRKTQSRAIAPIAPPRKRLRKATSAISSSSARAVASCPQERISDSVTVAASQPTLRALTVYRDDVPPCHWTFRVTEDGAEPHLARGEYAVIDSRDRDLQNGELYVIQYESGPRRRAIIQVRSSYLNITGPGAADSLVWWCGDIRGYRNSGKSLFDVPIFTGLSDGPYRSERLQSKLLGRVIGVAFAPLGFVLPQEAGYADLHGGNAAFDAAEYIDVLIATGHKPYVMGGLYFEEMPKRPLSPSEERLVMAVRWKFVEASTALERVTAECIRRGLIDVGA